MEQSRELERIGRECGHADERAPREASADQPAAELAERGGSLRDHDAHAERAELLGAHAFARHDDDRRFDGGLQHQRSRARATTGSVASR